MVRTNMADSPTGVHAPLEELSSSEILTGTLLFADRDKFPEQAVYSFFRDLGSSDQTLSRRFRVFSSEGGRLRSEPLRRIIDHLEMGKILELPLPNPVDQFYALRPSQVASVRADLEERGVLPAYESALKKLAAEFSRKVRQLKKRPEVNSATTSN